MIHISIEGMDGIGKTTTCRLLESKLGYKFVEKPLHYLFDKNENCFEEYLRIRDQVNVNPNRVFTSWFYGLGSLYMYEKFKYDNIITDRHLASNYAWSGNETNLDVYKLLLDKLGEPTLTVILKANPEVILSRLKNRNSNDTDINKINKANDICDKMIKFCRDFNLKHIIIDTSFLTPEEVVEIIIKEINNDKY